MDELRNAYDSVYSLLEDCLIIDKEYHVDNVLTSIISGDRQLWLNYKDGKVNGAVVTKILEYPRTRKMLIHVCSGTGLNEWMNEGLKKIEAVAKEHNCDSIELHGRKGWKKLLTDFQERAIILHKRL